MVHTGIQTTLWQKKPSEKKDTIVRCEDTGGKNFDCNDGSHSRDKKDGREDTGIPCTVERQNIKVTSLTSYNAHLSRPNANILNFDPNDIT